MRLIFTLVLSVAMTAFVSAQNGDYEAHNEGWLVKIDEAYAESQKTGKPIMANFTGSDWCGWCIKLTRDVFSKDEFKKWAEDNVVLLELDFPRRKQLPADLQQQNNSLRESFKVTGYPTVWVFDLDKSEENGNFTINALGKTGYNRSVEAFITQCDEMIERSNRS